MRLSRDELRHGVVLGLLYGVAQVMQTTGLERTPATVSGFVTGMYVVATPIFAAVLLHERITRTIWVAVVIATIGLGFLSLSGFAVSFGVLIIFASAMLYALHIIGLGRWSRETNAVRPGDRADGGHRADLHGHDRAERDRDPADLGGWSALLYMAVVSGAMAMLGQTWAQAHMSSARAAIIMTMEPVLAAFFAVLFGGESLTGRMLVGGGLVLAAMYIVELAPRRRVEAEVAHLTG